MSPVEILSKEFPREPVSGDWFPPFDAALAAKALRGAVKAFVEGQTLRRPSDAYAVASLAARAAEDGDDLIPLRWLGEEIRGPLGAVIYAVAVAEGFFWEQSPYMADHVEAAFGMLEAEAPGLITEQRLREWATADETT